MTTSMQTARTDAVGATAVAAGARAASAAAGGRRLLIAWAVLVLLCLAFWAGVAGLLVAIS